MKIANILVSGVWGDVSPEALNRGIGGREGAMIYLSREWAKQGHQVTNFVNIEESARFEPEVTFPPGQFEYDGPNPWGVLGGYHEYVPLNLTRPVLSNFPYDVAIAWECPSIFENHQILENTKLRICEMQVCHFGGGEVTAANNYCDYVAALSNWHKGFLISQGLELEDDEVVVFPNGVDITRYPEEEVSKKIGHGLTVSPQFIYSSSPDRGLWPLLKVWPKIRKEFRNAELLVGYGVEQWIGFNKWQHSRPGEMAVEIEKLMKQPGVTDIGKIGQDKLSELQIGADAWLYPLDAINATESGCITAVENAAAGNPIVTTDCDCMASEFGRIGRIVDLPWDEDAFLEATMDVLTDADYYTALQKKGRKFAEGRDWSIIAESWLDLFTQHV